MSLYNFKRLIKKYSRHTGVIKHRQLIGTDIDMSQGGAIVDKYEDRDIWGAIIDSEDNLVYDIGGFRSENKYFLYCYFKLNNGDIITLDNGAEYTVMLSKDHSRYDTYNEGLHIYELRSDKDG